MNIKHINKGKKDKCLGKEKRLALPKKKKKKKTKHQTEVMASPLLRTALELGKG